MNLKRIAGVVVVVAVGAFATGAGAQNAVYKETKVIIKVDPAPPHGVVKSSPACIDDRKVRVFEVAPTPGLLGVTKTDENGRWRLDEQLGDASQFRAEVARGFGGGPTMCKKAVSKVVGY